MTATAPITAVDAEVAAWRQRDRAFGERLACGRHWRMLVLLYQAELRRTRISVDLSVSAVAAAGGPQTTGLRHVGQLEARKLIQRRADEGDRRRTLITLTPRGLGLVAGCFAGVPAPEPAPACACDQLAPRLAAIEAQLASLQQRSAAA